jgi:hypothetical protein
MCDARRFAPIREAGSEAIKSEVIKSYSYIIPWVGAPRTGHVFHCLPASQLPAYFPAAMSHCVLYVLYFFTARTIIYEACDTAHM